MKARLITGIEQSIVGTEIRKTQITSVV